MKLSYQQQVAFDESMHFMLNSQRLAMAFSGVAGSGKSTIVNEVTKTLDKLGVKYQVLAPTGRATSILRSKGVISPSTIHSWLYEPIIEDDILIEFRKRDDDDLQESADCLIVDEASMVTREIFEDLVSVGIPILFVGDAEQLPPVSNDNFDIMAAPHIHLTEVHRQAEGNPIIQLSRHMRETGNWDYSLAGDVIQFLPNSALHVSHLSKHKYDIMLAGTNRMRQNLNRLARFTRGFHSEIPDKGERVMCLKNKYITGQPAIYNGEIYEVIGRYLPSGKNEENKRHIFNLKSLDTDASPVGIKIRNDSWDEVEPRGLASAEDCFFTFGYAATVHKCQGSAFDDVMFVDQDVSFFLDRRRFRYTAITRAVERISIVQE